MKCIGFLGNYNCDNQIIIFFCHHRVLFSSSFLAFFYIDLEDLRCLLKIDQTCLLEQKIDGCGPGEHSSLHSLASPNFLISCSTWNCNSFYLLESKCRAFATLLNNEYINWFASNVLNIRLYHVSISSLFLPRQFLACVLYSNLDIFMQLILTRMPLSFFSHGFHCYAVIWCGIWEWLLCTVWIYMYFCWLEDSVIHQKRFYSNHPNYHFTMVYETLFLPREVEILMECAVFLDHYCSLSIYVTKTCLARAR